MPGLRSQSDLDRDIWEDAFRGHLIHWGGHSIPESDPESIHSYRDVLLRSDLSKWSKRAVPCLDCGADIAARNVSGLCKPCHTKKQRKGG